MHDCILFLLSVVAVLAGMLIIAFRRRDRFYQDFLSRKRKDIR